MTSTNQRPEWTHDRLAHQFDRLMNPYDIQRRLEVLIGDFLSSEYLQGELVLDAGCGTGRGTAELAKRGAKVVSVDIGANLLNYTSAHYPCLPVQSSVLTLPFRADTFKVVFSTEVIEHTPDPLRAVREMWRVLQPGGLLVLSTPNWLWQLPVRFASALKIRPYDGLENFVKPGELRQQLENCGGTYIDHRGIHILPFQFTFLHPLLRFTDQYGRLLLPLMINQCIVYRK